MATIETVNIEDVFPLEDEFGNNMATRDYSLKANQDYVKELAKSFGPKGVPDELVTLVRDGGIYRIKAGNSRVEAMKHLGTKKFEAIIEDESTKQAILETIIRTDTKKKYEDLEMSSFVRQLAMFGTDEYVAEVSGLETESVAKVRTAAKLVDDAADDMSLLHLIAIGEFADDPEAVEKLKNCSEKDYERIAKELRSKRRLVEREKEMRETLESLGVSIVDEIPSKMCHRISVNSASGIPDDLPEKSCARYSEWNGNYSIYVPEEEAEVDPEVEKAKAQIAEIENLYKVTEKHRGDWIASNRNNDLSALAELETTFFGPYENRVRNFLEEHGIELDDMFLRAVFAFKVNSKIIVKTWITSLEFIRDNCDNFIDLTDAMKKCGYEPCEEELTLYQLAQDELAPKEG